MKYYKLNYNGTAWDLIDLSKIKLSDYRQINLYDKGMSFYGIGLY